VAGPNERAAALVRKGLFSVTADRSGDAGVQVAAVHSVL
jgi:hypothetical protein